MASGFAMIDFGRLAESVRRLSAAAPGFEGMHYDRQKRIS